MANFVFTEAKEELLNGTIDLGADDIRVALVMTNTTADVDDGTGIDAATMAAITLDEYDGSGYARVALASEAVTKNSSNNSGDFDAADTTFSSLGAGTRQCQAAIVYQHVGADSSNIPLFYIDTGGFPFTGNGGDVTIQWNANGIMQLG